MDYGLLLEMGSLFLTVIFAISFDRKNINKQLYRLLKGYEISLIVNLSANIIRHLTTGYVSFIFTLITHLSFMAVYMAILLYYIGMFPNPNILFKKYGAVLFFVYIEAAILILITPITGWVFCYSNGVISNGPLYLISFFTGGFLAAFGIFLTIKENASKHIIISMLGIIIAVAIPTMVELIFYPKTGILVVGFGLTVALWLLQSTFVNGQYNMQAGTENAVHLFKELSRKNYKDILVIKISEEKITGAEELSEILKDFRKSLGTSTVYETSGNYVFLVPIKSADIIKIRFMHVLNKYPKVPVTSCFLRHDILKEPSMIGMLDMSHIWHEFTDDDMKYLQEQEIIENNVREICLLEDRDDARVMLVAQPILKRSEGKYMTAEILCRLLIPGIDNMISPYRFIPYVNKNGYAHAFNMIVLNKACKIIKRIENENIPFEGISVNFSPEEILMPNFISDISTIININEVRPESIHIEVTEVSEIKEVELFRSQISILSSLGFKIYLDDFGSGYSNLVELVKIPFDVVKFDKSLLDASENSNKARIIVKRMSETFIEEGFHVLYEGVETEFSDKMANEDNVDYIQGFKYSRPIPVNDFIEFLKLNNITAE